MLRTKQPGLRVGLGTFVSLKGGQLMSNRVTSGAVVQLAAGTIRGSLLVNTLGARMLQRLKRRRGGRDQIGLIQLDDWLSRRWLNWLGCLLRGTIEQVEDNPVYRKGGSGGKINRSTIQGTDACLEAIKTSTAKGVATIQQSRDVRQAVVIVGSLEGLKAD